MSDTLPASTHRVNSSGNCSISGCPCRGWSAQETADAIAFVDGTLRDIKDTNQLATTSEHQPAARSGGERIKVELINGVEGQCVAVNDYRICGPKPWGGGSIAQSWTTDKNDILRAFLTPDQKHAWLADELEVVSVNQHQALVAERELLRESLADMLSIIEDEGHVSNYVPQVTAARKILAESALTNAANKQRSTSE